MIHVSDLLHYKKCPIYCWKKRFEKVENPHTYSLNKPFSELWLEYLGMTSYSRGEVGDTNEDTYQKLKENSVLFMGRFTYQECRTRIPLLEKYDDGYRVTYPFLSATPKEHEALFMKINHEILHHCGIDVTSYRIVYLNKEYVRQDELEIHSLFLESDSLFNKRNHIGKDVFTCFESIDLDLESWIEETKQVLESPCQNSTRSKQCTTIRRCPYYDHCFDESDLPDDSILFLTTSQYKMDLFSQEISHIHELPLAKFDGFRLQYAQYMASKNGSFYDQCALKTWSQEIQKPISYLDFEWDTFAIPPYSGMKPFDVLCFQYSLHIEHDRQNLIHRDYFGTGDCRKEFIESLIANIPHEGSILVYNMEGAEKLRLKQLSIQFPEYKEQLDQICERMIDLSKPFEAGLFYDNRQRGHYSLKSLLPVFTDEYSYSQLNIQTGMSAVHAYRTFDQSDLKAQKEIRTNIRNYCKMDTFAEYVVYHGLLRLLKREVDIHA